MKTKACPVCGSKDTGTRINLYTRCPVCKSLYLINPPPPAYIEKTIQANGKTTSNEVTDSKIVRIFEERLGCMAPYIRPGARILDVGCGNGTFVRAAQKAGYEVEAMDKATSCVRRIRYLGIPAYTKLSVIPDRSYDAITLFDVIEHVPEPLAFMETIRRKLKRNGIVMLTTPNIEGITAKVVPGLLTYTKDAYSEHLVLFTPDSLTRVLPGNCEIIGCTTDILMN